MFRKRPKDEEVDQTVGDAVVAALNDHGRATRGAAMAALGALRYDRAVQASTDLFQYHGRGTVAEASSTRSRTSDTPRAHRCSWRSSPERMSRSS